MKYWKIVFWVLGILPIGFVISILSFYFHAGQILGNPPHYNQPDPKELDIYTDYSPFVDWTAEIWLWSVPIWLILSVVYLILKRKEINWRPIVISGTGQILGILTLLSGVFEWYR